MNVIRYKEADRSLQGVNKYVKDNETIVLVDGDSEGMAVMNQKLLEKIALSSFLASGLEDAVGGRVVEGTAFFDELESKLSDGGI